MLFLGIPLLVIVLKNLFKESTTGGTIEGSPKSTHKVRPAGFEAFATFLGSINRDGICRTIISLFLYSFVSVFFFILSSPQSFLNWNDFISSMNYESSVGLGISLPFYTRQFAGTVPIVFQFQKILPYALGWPTLIGAILGFFFLPSFVEKTIVSHIKKFKYVLVKRCVGLCYRKQNNILSESPEVHKDTQRGTGRLILTESGRFTEIFMDILRFSLLLSFLLPSFFFAKWTRFVSPSFPLFSLLAILFFIQVTKKNIKIITIIIFITVMPGIAYLSVYLSPDIRFTASDWIYKNIPANSKILSETANVIDIPVSTDYSSPTTNSYLLNSFNFYDLDSSPQLQKDLSEALKQADYIIVPSRRIFKNHSSTTDYPLLTTYYSNLFSGRLGFEKVAEFSSYPKITLFSKTLVEFPDEDAEETWTVFDHPVIRIYKRMTNDKLQISNPLRSEASQNQITNNQTDFSRYKTTNYQLPTNHQPLTTTLSLLVAYTPEKWERGLMYVKNRKDIGGLDGMIFTFPDSQIRSFWNENTLSRLMLYWIQNNKVIGVSKLPSITESGVITTISSPSPADTVIEIVR